MALRTAVRNSGVLPYALLLAVAWIGYSTVQVAWATGPFAGLQGPYVGQALTTGVVGVLTLLVIGGFTWTLYDEMGSNQPAPESFPPGE